jgi:uncharacterized membrane protein
MVFFGWILAPVTVVLVIFPFKTGATLAEKIATAAVYLVIGFAIGTLISGVGERAVRRRRAPSAPAGGYPAQEYSGRDYQGQAYPGQTYRGRDY